MSDDPVKNSRTCTIARSSTSDSIATHDALARRSGGSSPAVHVEAPTGSADSRWLALRHELWPGSPDEEHLADMRAAWDRGDCLLLALADGEAIGFVEAARRVDYVNGTSSSPVGFVEGLYVRPTHRRHGVARALIDEVIAWARAEGLAEIASDALLDNTASHAVHRALGVAETERVIYFRRAIPRT